MNLDVLPREVADAFGALTAQGQAQAQELRFRLNRPVTVVYPWGETVLLNRRGGIPVTDKLLEEILARATGFSPYALRLEETGLYLPMPGGCRLGLCGEGVMKDGRLAGIRRLSSLSLRLARQVTGIAGKAAERLVGEDGVASALILSPPGGGKTTFLRDLIRCISQKGYRVATVDERQELSGGGSLDLGPTTDVLLGVPKREGIPLLIRAMNPQVLAVDEICGREELEEALYAAFSGVSLLATAHGRGKASLLGRPLYSRLIRSGAFTWIIILEGRGKMRMERLRLDDEMDGSYMCDLGISDGGLGNTTGNPGAPGTAAADTVGAGADAGGTGAEYAAPSCAV